MKFIYMININLSPWHKYYAVLKIKYPPISLFTISKSKDCNLHIGLLFATVAIFENVPHG